MLIAHADCLGTLVLLGPVKLLAQLTDDGCRVAKLLLGHFEFVGHGLISSGRIRRGLGGFSRLGQLGLQLAHPGAEKVGLGCLLGEPSLLLLKVRAVSRELFALFGGLPAEFGQLAVLIVELRGALLKTRAVLLQLLPALGKRRCLAIQVLLALVELDGGLFQRTAVVLDVLELLGCLFGEFAHSILLGLEIVLGFGECLAIAFEALEFDAELAARLVVTNLGLLKGLAGRDLAAVEFLES